jgi:hypothetical protein
MRCDRCGATIEESAFCKYCGARVARPDRTAMEAATARARYELARASPGHAVAAAHTPRVSAGMEVVMGLVVATFAIAFIVLSQSVGGGDHAPAWFRVAFLAVPVAMVVGAGVMIYKAITFARAPVRRLVQVVVDERTSTSGGGDRAVTTRYYATLQSEDGARIEVPTEGWLAGRIAPGDIGVAFLKGGRLVEFLRLEV